MNELTVYDANWNKAVSHCYGQSLHCKVQEGQEHSNSYAECNVQLHHAV